LILKAEGRGRALLVSSETADPGWKAQVDGKPKTLQMVNYAFRGIVLNEGESRVVLNYEPLSFRLGLFLAFLVMGWWIEQIFKRFWP